MTIKFYATRDEARRIAREEGLKLVDAGSTAVKGSRWGVDFPEVEEPQNDDADLIAALKQAIHGTDTKVLSVPLKAPEHVSRRVVRDMKDRKGNTIHVYSKRKIAVE